MHKFIVSLLVFLALNFETDWKGVSAVGFPPTQAPATAPVSAPVSAPASAPLPPPPPPPPPPPLPKIEVDAVNSLLQLFRMPGAIMDSSFSPTDCGSYKYKYAITCNCRFRNNTACRVTHIDLRNQNLRGKIPEQIGDLRYLRSLDLSSNMLVGSIPVSFQNLSKLSELYLSKNSLEGPVPGFLGNMTSLRNLYLSDNWFNESIPREFGNLPSLEYLSIRNNFLSESIPDELGNISSLTGLYLQDNQLLHQLPEQLGNLSNLQELYLMNNFFAGALPSSLHKLIYLQDFNIRGNNFHGTIPEFIANWQDLRKLILSGNGFHGPLPTAITKLKELTYISINDLVGEGIGFSFPKMTNLSWTILTLRNCSLIGPIPDFIWKLPYLEYLDLSFNNLSGGIPANVNSRFLKCIFLRGNKLNEMLPGWLINLKQAFVDVSENFFTNTSIPPASISPNLNLFACCSNISNVDMKWLESDYNCANNSLTYDRLYINCGGNATFINGSYYEADLQSNGASTFFLSHNKAWGYSSMGTFLNTNHKQYIFNKTCNISMADAPLYSSARGAPISLKYYGFCLKNGNYTLRLHFAEIGWDATKISIIKNRRVFDVEIQDGQHYLKNFNIEEEAKGVDKNVTKEFNITVTDKRLEIHLYWSGYGSTSAPTKYYGPLISAISLSPVPKERHKLSSAIIGGIAGSATFFVILVLALFWKLGWLGAKDEEVRAELFPGGVFNFQQIKAATKNFDPENQIGEGGFGAVYKGVLPNGTKVAIKQLARKSKQGAREFINEIGTIYALKHRNLVRLLGCCAEQNELLLVYEYMENNSLKHVLFGPEDLKSRLNWLIRVKICRDVAKGLAFLHEESKLKIIHSDIKPTNILLDKDFTAKISDFGYAQLNEDETSLVIRQIPGTAGYVAPECVQEGRLSPKADVYSFGIVVLEIVSGKNISTPRSKDQTVYLLDVAYGYQKQGNIIALVDASLGSDYTYNEALSILNLAMECVSPSPKLRPSMSEVVKVLEGIVKVVESKRKGKTTSPANPLSENDSTTAKPLEDFFESTQSASTAEESTSDMTISLSASKEISQLSTSTDQFSEIGKQEIASE